ANRTVQRMQPLIQNSRLNRTSDGSWLSSDLPSLRTGKKTTMGLWCGFSAGRRRGRRGTRSPGAVDPSIVSSILLFCLSTSLLHFNLLLLFGLDFGLRAHFVDL